MSWNHLKRWSRPLLIFLLLTNTLFIILHILYRNGILTDGMFSLGRERGYSALFLFGLEFCLLLLMGTMAVRTAQPVYFHWTALFTYFFFDDLFEVHETVGAALAILWEFPVLFDLRPRDWGEMVVYATTGLYFLLTLLLTYAKSDTSSRQFSRYLTVLVIVLVVAGIGADMAYYMVDSRLLRELFVIIEDGGEIVLISLILWSVFDCLVEMPTVEPRLIRSFRRFFFFVRRPHGLGH